MHTSAGSLALAERYAVQDAFVAARLRAAGAVLCGKTKKSPRGVTRESFGDIFLHSIYYHTRRVSFNVF